jgi:hypothetical protein
MHLQDFTDSEASLSTSRLHGRMRTHYNLKINELNMESSGQTRLSQTSKLFTKSAVYRMWEDSPVVSSHCVKVLYLFHHSKETAQTSPTYLNLALQLLVPLVHLPDLTRWARSRPTSLPTNQLPQELLVRTRRNSDRITPKRPTPQEYNPINQSGSSAYLQ